ncbi:MAG: DUF4381 domain-containing protein [Mariprofundales bacterium]|nr:DUF4381 domain-containing protein [Mariprofundales bacterium]
MPPHNPDPLAQLRDIHLPESVSWWPPAPGWWILLGVVVIALIAGWVLIRRYRQSSWQRRALQQLTEEIEQIESHYKQSNDGAAACSAISSLLRRVAVSTSPEQTISGIHGDRWLQFLDQQEYIPQRFVNSRLGTQLLNAPFSSDNSDPLPLIHLCHQWMESAIRHRNSGTQ